ncbi:hypothetical protein J0X14_14610 [Muricauda sp. CAU 1633]|uniref:hypothetical protein n=1 Tax=Allomuricauda sp. CAU 1633 TaxID=2816036 RepID=UPI001A8EF2D5|nr:hypothetical protein [Muricauda sp. CAU 1633]MBO0323538.1 hypothetical protein [Muricauda sp. CAU 1633]
MKKATFFLSALCLCASLTKGFSQTEDYYAQGKEGIIKTEFEDITHELKFVSKENPEDAYTIGWGKLVAKIIPLLVDGASKLFYNPDNFNKEYFATYSFFDESKGFETLDPNKTLVFDHLGTNNSGEKERIARFKFEIGAVTNVEGYHYIGLKEYEVNHSWAKLSSLGNQINYILDIGFYYFDDADKAREFHINPILLDSVLIDGTSMVIEDPNFQVIPKMKVLQNIQVRIREVNSKKQNWDRYLELYQDNMGNISNFLIRALPK